jgi:hypothetical protein
MRVLNESRSLSVPQPECFTKRGGAQQGTAAEPSRRLTPPSGSPSLGVQTAVVLVEYPVVQPCFLRHGRWRPCHPLVCDGVPENLYRSPDDANDAPARRWRLSSRAIVRGFVVFLAAWLVLAMAAHVLIPLDPHLDPEIDAKRDRVANIIYPIVFAVSALLGLLECCRVSRGMRR